jgi:hypothetical protein
MTSIIINNTILLVLKRIFNNNDIINKIYNIYLIDKYFAKNMNTKSVKLFKQRYSVVNNEYIDIIVKNIKPTFQNIYFIKKIMITYDITFKFLLQTPSLIKYVEYKYKNDEKIILELCKKDIKTIKYISNELKSDHIFINKILELYPLMYFILYE